jgi:aryl-alcohol dehydrogenase-like predicted oxidoreductase
MPDMRYRQLGDSELQVSEISLGSWLTYGRGAAEEVWGEILADHDRDGYVLATKVYFPMPELVPRDRIWVNLDHAQQGIGTASCGPGVLPQHRLEVVRTTCAVRLSPLSRSRA